jgi:hypothetical protein
VEIEGISEVAGKPVKIIVWFDEDGNPIWTETYEGVTNQNTDCDTK